MPEIICFEGILGGGKTLGGLKYALDVQDIDPRYVLYTNVKILDESINYKELDFSELMVKALRGEDFEDEYVILFFDEILNYLDARTSFDTKNRVISFLISQVRKRHAHLVYTGTDVMLADVRLRDQTKFTIRASKREANDFWNTIGIGSTMPYEEMADLADELCWIECDDSDCPNYHAFNYEVWKIKQTTKELVNSYWVFNPGDFYGRYDSYDMPPPIDNMSQEQIARIMPRITNLGDSRNAFILHLPVQMREESEEFQNRIYRPFAAMKQANKGADFEFKTNSTGLIDAVIWRGIRKSEDRKTVEDIVNGIKPTVAPEAKQEVKELQGDDKFKNMLTI